MIKYLLKVPVLCNSSTVSYDLVDYKLTCGCGRHGQQGECCCRTDPTWFCCSSRCAGSATPVASRVKLHTGARHLSIWCSWTWTSLTSRIALPASRTSPSNDHINPLECKANYSARIGYGTISNDREWPLTQSSRACHYSTLNVSETTLVRAMHRYCCYCPASWFFGSLVCWWYAAISPCEGCILWDRATASQWMHQWYWQLDVLKPSTDECG